MKTLKKTIRAPRGARKASNRRALTTKARTIKAAPPIEIDADAAAFLRIAVRRFNMTDGQTMQAARRQVLRMALYMMATADVAASPMVGLGAEMEAAGRSSEAPAA